MITRRDLDDPATILHKDHFTVEELADLLEMDPHVIRHAAREGELRAAIVDHHILGLRREDVLTWLARRGLEATRKNARPKH